jgi:hypothetical protein
MMVFVLLTSFNVFGDGEPSDCRSWWSGTDGVHHCLLSENGEDDRSALAPKETEVTRAKHEEPNPDDISAPNNLTQPQGPPPGFQITDIPEK